ncbi:MAG: amidohydrolase [Thermoanaerobaculaceae bacterium]|nr:amidohydrolase [Thermoanaerobaculaceae bacterium]MDI9620526.1 amidohydrolase [Acidobacteriota bacterium]NLH11953.1 amidohydrolase [Holophagae bacterium]
MRSWIVVLSLVLPLLLTACARGSRCDRLLLGGVVHAPDGVRRLEVAIEAGRIAALVEPEDVSGWQRRAGEVVALEGAHVYPGFTEAHAHLTGIGAALEQVDLTGATSLEEVIARAQAAATKQPAGTWVVGRGWDQNLWPDKSFPHHGGLSAAIPAHPVALRRVDGHAVLTNARGLATAGITRETVDPPGGRIVRDGHGEPTGVLVDAAEELLDRVLPNPSPSTIERRMLAAAAHLASLGHTSVHDAGTTRDELAVLRKLQAQGTLGVRVWVMLDGGDDTLLDAELANGPQVSADGMLSVRAVKLYADGALGSRGAWLSAPYSDDPATSGLEVTPLARLSEVVRRAAHAGFSPSIHAIGDAAVRRVLDVFEQQLGDTPGLRPRVEHAQIVAPADVPRFAALGAIASVQPTHATSDMPWAPERLGPERTAWAYRWRSLLAAGARLALGSDAPIESSDPRLGIWAAVTRQTPDGQPPEGWNRDEALTVAEAIAGYTEWAAYAGGEEGWRGRLAPGFAADLTVLDRDLEVGPPASILQARVVRTVVAGRDMFVGGSTP